MMGWETIEECVWTSAGVACGVSVIRPNEDRDVRVALLYLHGGGLVYGERDDLPVPYAALLLRAGYTLVCVDYPLAPEVRLPIILDSVCELWRWFVRVCMPRYSIGRYLLFGRSAGAYLALMLAGRLISTAPSPHPEGLICLYGYHDLTSDFLRVPSKLYRAMPEVGGALASRLCGHRPISSAPKSRRFALYVHARQTGSWAELLGVADMDSARAHSLGAEQIRQLPPLFIAASTGDEDVPYACSKRLWRVAPNAVMRTVYHLGHDFDRDLSQSDGRQVYEQIVAWMGELLAREGEGR